MLAVMARGVLAACLLLGLQSPAVRFDGARNLFLLEDWPAGQIPEARYPEVLSVFVDMPDVPPLLGTYRIENGALAFAPQFPLQPGMRYRAVGRVPGSDPLVTVVDIPRVEVKPSAVVDRIYPSSHVLPENQLKFYIQFSSPMARGFAYRNVALFEESGARVDDPFLELGEELWDPEGRRFTLFFDPGRIKRGLVSQEELGAALHQGRRYTLVIDKGWRDANGVPMASEYRKTFVVGRADRAALDPDAWKVKEPASGGRAALELAFPEPMDHAILLRDIEVRDSSSSPVLGAVSIGPNEETWRFTPDIPWKKGLYTLELGSAIADLAGNMIGRPFEIDVLDEERPTSTHTLPFNVK